MRNNNKLCIVQASLEANVWLIAIALLCLEWTLVLMAPATPRFANVAMGFGALELFVLAALKFREAGEQSRARARMSSRPPVYGSQRVYHLAA